MRHWAQQALKVSQVSEEMNIEKQVRPGTIWAIQGTSGFSVGA
jgi:hypothetical protein